MRDSAHTLYVRLYPLATPDGFTAADQAALLSDPPPAIAGAVGTPRSLSLHPGTAVKLEVDDKPAPFTSVGVVAGYYKPLGQTKVLVTTAQVPAGACFTIRFGESGIDGVEQPSIEKVSDE